MTAGTPEPRDEGTLLTAKLRRPRGNAEPMTAAEYDALLARQGGVCPICLMPPKTRRLDRDHDHRTGKVRGLLTHKCNRGLVYFADDPARLRRAADYLEGLL